MNTTDPQIERFVRDQVKRWRMRECPAKGLEGMRYTAVTVAMEPGSGGREIARRVARYLHYDFFDRNIIQGIAQSARISEMVIQTMEKERLTGIEDFLSLLVHTKYIHPDTYLRHLMKVINTIARHGCAVIVGRGANFILPPERRFSVRVVAPQEIRVKNVAHHFGTTLEEAKKRVVRRESRRRAFVRDSLHTDIANPLAYDMILNTAEMDMDSAVGAVLGALGALGVLEEQSEDRD